MSAMKWFVINYRRLNILEVQSSRFQYWTLHLENLHGQTFLSGLCQLAHREKMDIKTVMRMRMMCRCRILCRNITIPLYIITILYIIYYNLVQIIQTILVSNIKNCILYGIFQYTQTQATSKSKIQWNCLRIYNQSSSDTV